MTTIRYIAALVSTLTLLCAAPAFALSVGVGTGDNITIGLPAQASVQAGTLASDTNASEASNAAVNTNVNTNSALSVPLVVTQADVSADSAQSVQIGAQAVQTKMDLSAYIAGRMKADVNLASVDAASDHVAVTYVEPAAFLGLFPVSVETTATTDASGNVTISQPWWTFLAANSSAHLQSNVQTSVNGVLGASATGNTSLSASQQARLVFAMESALASTANATVSANMGASSSVSTQ